LKFGQPRVMALFLALTLFQHLIDGFHNRDLRALVADLLGVTKKQYTAGQMTYDLRRLRLKGLIFRPPKTNRYFLTPYGWKVARLFSRLEARVFRPAQLETRPGLSSHTYLVPTAPTCLKAPGMIDSGDSQPFTECR
jgi:hypothetical protein